MGIRQVDIQPAILSLFFNYRLLLCIRAPFPRNEDSPTFTYLGVPQFVER
jgi:hypothetical protein